jgi:hypothetical protein
MPAASVPEAAIHEDGEPLRTEGKIRAAREELIAAPACDAVPAENGDEPELGVLVAGGADGGHDLRALLFGENISHPEKLSGVGGVVSNGN